MDGLAAAWPVALFCCVFEVLKRARFRVPAACAVQFLLVGMLACAAENGRAATAADGACPGRDLSAVEYLRLGADEQKEGIEAYRGAYRSAMEAVVYRLRKLFADKPVKIQFRLKTVESIQEKLIRKGYRCLSQMTDIAGVRVLILDYAAIPFVSQTVQGYFTVREKEDLINDPRETGYRAIHYLLSMAGRIVELQIHTVRGNIWALMSYSLVYKGPYRSNEAVVNYFKVLSRVLYLLDSGFGHREMPLPTNLPLSARREIRGGLMLIQAYE